MEEKSNRVEKATRSDKKIHLRYIFDTFGQALSERGVLNH